MLFVVLLFSWYRRGRLTFFQLNRFFLKCRVLINNPFITLFDLLLNLHMGNVLNVLEVIRLVNKLVLEEHDVTISVQFFTLVTACLLTLVAREHYLLVVMNLTIRFGSVRRLSVLLWILMLTHLFLHALLIIFLLGLLEVIWFGSAWQLLVLLPRVEYLWLDRSYLVVWFHWISSLKRYFEMFFNLSNKKWIKK